MIDPIARLTMAYEVQKILLADPVAITLGGSIDAVDSKGRHLTLDVRSVGQYSVMVNVYGHGDFYPDLMVVYP
jgi:hypothetical protein